MLNVVTIIYIFLPICNFMFFKGKRKSYGDMHLKEIIKTNHVQLKSRISCHSECVLKVGDSGHFSS